MDQIRSPFFSLSTYITLLVLSGAMAVCSFASGSCPKSVSGEWQSVDDLNNAPKVSIAARKIYTMVQGEIGRPVFLTETEYRKRVEEESIAEESILFVDRLPTDIDLPTVRGVVMGTPLVAEGTHIQVFAEKMEIPLVLVPKFQEIPVFKEALESQKPISINSESQLVVRTYS
ncbi:MAG: hypothetical protein KDD61_08430, partial [Bdellovibrionales bacterium]|nr:hypothetical protein [Bdellovibrionales bacterium]